MYLQVILLKSEVMHIVQCTYYGMKLNISIKILNIM